mmetsp:Transcript_1109/g.2707  ORF Transcript_1109/g.2707 Transcript_1109/m.2707 type:complete len:302 (+) Transcript_1109:5653-6558(+)
MVTAQSANDVFLELKNDTHNRVCFDCEVEEAHFASISYGSFICQRCSEAHARLGKETSFIKPLDSDTWSLKQLKLMTVGGNSELRAFFDLYGIPARAPPEYKYNTLAARYYRERLLSIGESRPYEAPQPTPEEGLAMIRHPAPAPEPESSGGISGFFSSAFSTVKSVGSSVVSKAQEITQDPRVKVWEERAVSALNTAGSVVKSGAEWTYERGREISENPTFQSAVSTVKSTASSAVSKVGEMAAYSYDTFTSNPHVQEVSEGAKKKLAELEQKARQEASSLYSRIAGPSDERPNTPPEYR